LTEKAQARRRPAGGHFRAKGFEMNERIIKVAHMVAVGLMLLAGVAAVTR
jgi:hypothetical protein